jgi:hypothetical protein
MPSSEDYTVVWAGIYRRLEADELSQVAARTHPLVQSASEVGLEFWYDTFEVDPVEGNVYCLLIGRHLATLGYKEGQTQWSLDGQEIIGLLDQLHQHLKLIEVWEKAQLYVFVHIEDVDDEV